MSYIYNDLRCETRGNVLLIELNRPSKRNAMRLELREELIDALQTAEVDENIHGIVITGAGDRAFSAGADLNELRLRTMESEMARPALLRRQLPQVAETLSKPIVSAINGACIGAGLEFALSCPIRLSSTDAVFGLPEVKLGLVPGSGGTQRLTRVVGLGWSMHLTLVGDPIDAETALNIGLVTAIYPADKLVDEAVELVTKMAHHPGMAYMAARDAVNRAFDVDQATGIDFERKLFALCLSTGVPREQATRLLDEIAARKEVKAAESANA